EMHIFALASLKETFGLVYVEALTQGLPILYSEGEGIDGLFDDHYGRACNPRSKASIAAALAQITQLYSRLSIDGDYLSAQFDWRKIAETYLSLYSKRS
ncbi:MAG: glycosyltransferase, partial [Bacteroidia bacterium]|nr:glycosyltransferase [Bacteroidia bacterium]